MLSLVAVIVAVPLDAQVSELTVGAGVSAVFGGLLIGALLGAIIGVSVGSEHWERVRLPDRVSVRPLPARGVPLQVTVRW
jgi:hypothetical protein